ncbi:MAG: nucleotidyl transferase AbiEii/AbiGii toxin family protein [Acidobacteria bacterium]|nr:nucleotidyl transferase AbiEii/AbiGii toxin family protein [Acidobacteriota bacterium]
MREKIEGEDGIRVDAPEEILANKLGALLSRAEIRDLVDVRALEAAGLNLETALSDASRKDSGLTPATLGWVVSQIRIGDDAALPGGVTVTELRNYINDLSRRLAAIAFPPPGQRPA